MKKCLKCNAEMKEDLFLMTSNGYAVDVREGGIFKLSLGKVKCAVCPECGYIELYIADTDGVKNVKDRNGDSVINLQESVDPVFRKALEFAVDNKTVSTSMLQRKISLGYGRAAKLLDKMEELKFISPPKNRGPRNVLLSREAFDEMVKNEDPRIDGIFTEKHE